MNSTEGFNNRRTEAAPGNLIAFQGVDFRYGKGDMLLLGVDFSILPGSFQFLTGPSGSGKTTVFKLILGILKPVNGKIIKYGIATNDLNSKEIILNRQRIRAVFQNPHIIEYLTVYENVFLPKYVLGGAELANRRLVIELINWIGLRAKREEKAGNLSAGEKQRLAIAQALICKPDVIIADEPTANVDPLTASKLLDIFVEVNRLGTAVMLATHDLGLMERSASSPVMVIKGNTLYSYKEGELMKSKS